MKIRDGETYYQVSARAVAGHAYYRQSASITFSFIIRGSMLGFAAWLSGLFLLRGVAARHVSGLSGVSYSGERNCVISAGGLSGILNVLLATIEIGDEVIVTDPTYAGLINRVRLAGGVPRFTPFGFEPGREWRLDREALRASIGPKTTAMLLMSPSMPSGGCLDAGDWALVAELCVAHDLLLIVDTAMERLVFDCRPVLHPAGLPAWRSGRSRSAPRPRNCG